MAKRERLGFVAIKTEGAILPPSILRRIHAVDEKLGGLKPEDFGLSGTRVREAASQAWTALQGPWLAFKAKRDQRGDDDMSFGPAGDWVRQILRALDYGATDLSARGIPLGDDGKFKVSALLAGHCPIFVVGHGAALDKRPSNGGMTPHGNVQLLLNASEANLWGFVTNGLQWRILRDSVSLSRQAMVEIDLEAVFEGGLYDEFLLFFLLCHQSRMKAERATDCLLEKWSQVAGEEGKRSLDTLRHGVQKAIEALGQGFLQHPQNLQLRDRVRTGGLDRQDYYRQLLRLVYRLLFLFVAEDRDLLSAPESTESQRRLYRESYSTRRLRLLAERVHGSDRHYDLYIGLKLVLTALADPAGCPDLGIFPLGGLFKKTYTPDIDSSEIANSHLLKAVRLLAITVEDGRQARVDFKNLGSEELGSVYESLLELHPEMDADGTVFSLKTASGNERKSTGAYYTPDALIQCLLDSALEPVVAEALRIARRQNRRVGEETPEAEAILALRILDPAVGSGHFLIAAAHRLAKRLAQVRTGDEEPSPAAVRAALRAVVKECLYGVDINPMAAELCKVALWMESMEPGRPLTFLEHHIQVGNSLLGATPELIRDGIPDAAYDAVANPTRRAELKRQNRGERSGVRTLFIKGIDDRQSDAARQIVQIEKGSEMNLAEINAKERRYEDLTRDREFESRFTAADLWAASFSPTAYDTFTAAAAGLELTTEAVFRADELPEATLTVVRRYREQFRFFHFHLAFPEVFKDGGGFDVVLGNPPWERVKLQEKEFFASRAPEIANARNADARKRLIEAERQRDTALWKEFNRAREQAEAEARMLTKSGRFPLAGRGDVNTFAVFAELKRSLLRSGGRVGMILPSGIATDDTTRFFFQDLVDKRSLVSLFDFQSGPGLWSEIGHARFKFCLLTMTGSDSPVTRAARFAFFLRHVTHLDDQDRVFELSSEDIALLNPNTKTCPVFRTRRDAEITKAIYRRVPVLISQNTLDGNPWGISFQRMFDMSNDSNLFRSRDELEEAEGHLESNHWTVPKTVTIRGRVALAGRWLPLYEAKMIHHFDHRWATYDAVTTSNGDQVMSDVEARDATLSEKQNQSFVVQPRYWVAEADVNEAARTPRCWFVGFRNICRSTDVRTAIFGLLPRSAVGHSTPLVDLETEPVLLSALVACLSSFACDYVVRQKLGGTNFTYGYVNQIPIPPSRDFLQACPWDASITMAEWIAPRSLELCYTADDLTAFAKDLGYDGPPFRWDEDRRYFLRAEMDAAFFHIYGIEREDAGYIMDTFHIVRENDLKVHGRYRTKETILEIFDDMATASRPRTSTPPSTPPSYASTDDERAQVALAYAVITSADGATDPDVLQALILAMNPDLCRGILADADHARYDGARAASDVVGAAPRKAIDWAQCRGYLELLGVIRVDRDASIQRIYLVKELHEPLATRSRAFANEAMFGRLALERVRKGLEGTQGAARTLDELVVLAGRGTAR